MLLCVNEQDDFFREQIRDFANHVSEQNVDEGMASRCAENETRRAERGGDVGDGFRSGRGHGIAEKRRMIAGFSLGRSEDFARFGIVLPSALTVLLGHETLLAHKEQIKPAPSLARLAQGKVERASSATNGAENGFLAREMWRRPGAGRRDLHR